MIKKVRLKSEYLKLKQREAPDLWNRIESNLEIKEIVEKKQINRIYYHKYASFYWVLGSTLAVVACFLLFIRVGSYLWPKPIKDDGIIAEANTQQATEETAKPIGDLTALQYHDLPLAKANLAKVPQGAIKVLEDEFYFSEVILQDADLLCEVTIVNISFEEDSSGVAIYIIYEVSIDQVLYSEGYIKAKDRIRVKSPMVENSLDNEYLLYQLGQNRSYILPLKAGSGDYELIFPFAPQIEVTLDGRYIFHTGWQSLVTEETEAVLKESQAPEDFYFDRMLIREDNAFLSDLTMLTQTMRNIGRN